MNTIAHKEPFAWLATAFTVFSLITLSPLGHWLESSMPMHVLVEIPLLIISGAILGKLMERPLKHISRQINIGGITGMLIASFTLAVWMVPRWLDASLTLQWVAWSKYLSLPLLVGLPLSISWSQLHPIARGVVKIEFLSMLFRLGWLYIISPERLCNNYLLDEQELLGQGFLIIGAALSVTWLIPVFFTYSERAPERLTSHSPESDTLENNAIPLLEIKR